MDCTLHGATLGIKNKSDTTVRPKFIKIKNTTFYMTDVTSQARVTNRTHNVRSLGI